MGRIPWKKFAQNKKKKKIWAYKNWHNSKRNRDWIRTTDLSYWYDACCAKACPLISW